MKKTINWNKIWANAGLAFCTTLIATGYNTHASIINAGLLAAIALFTELKFESEPISKVQRALQLGLIV